MKVILVGPDPSVQGGVSQGMRLLLQYPPPEVSYLLVPTITPAGNAAVFRGSLIPYLYRGVYSLLFFARALAHLTRLVHTERPELAHVRFSSYGSAFRKCVVARRLHRLGIPFILAAHGSEFDRFYAKLNPLIGAWVSRMFTISEGLIVLSQRWAQFYQSIPAVLSKPIWVLPNAVVLPNEPIVWETSPELHLLFLGTLNSRKGPDRVLKAVALLPSDLRQRVRLYIAGNGAVEETKRLSKDLGLDTLVEIRDWIEGDTKLHWLRTTNAFILPSRAEGLPNSMLEAMAWGKALIVSPVGGIPEFVDDGVEGFIVPADDIEAIACAIRKLVEDPSLRVRMGQAARARVEPLDIQRYRVRLGEIYREVLERHCQVR